MARVGGDTTPAPAAPAPTAPPTAPFDPDNITVTDAELQAEAAALDIPWSEMGDVDKEFLGQYIAARKMDAQEANDPTPNPNDPNAPHPLIPTDEPDPTRTEATVGASDDDGAESGSGPDSSSGGGAGDDAGTATVPVTPPVAPTPPQPPTPPVQPQPAPTAQPQFTPLELEIIEGIRSGIVHPQLIDPNTGRPAQIGPDGNIMPGAPPIPNFENLDEDTQAAMSAVWNQQQQMAAQQQQYMDAQMQSQRAAFAGALQNGVNDFMGQTGMNEEQVDALAEKYDVTELASSLTTQYPGDPRSAIHAALSAAFWMDPDLRGAAVASMVQQQIETNSTTDAKKAAAAGLGGGAGSVSRELPQPTTREGRDAGMLAAIEQALARPNGSG